MREQPLVSVLMTVYNREKYLSEAIESVITSTYQNWELILVDDCSSDASVEIAKAYQKKDPRIHFYLNEYNLGDYPNRNKAASYAKGKYLKYLDADDLLYPHGLEVMVKSIEQFPQAGLALCRPDDDIKPYPYCLNPSEAYNEHFFKKNLLTNAPLSTIISRDAFESVGGFSGVRFVGDLELWLNLSSKYSVVKMVSGLAFWRGHDDQELLKGWVNMDYPPLQLVLNKKFIFNKTSPLQKDKQIKAWKKYRLDLKKMILKKLLRLKFKESFRLAKAYKII